MVWPACLSCVTGICYCYCWRGGRGGGGCCTVLVFEPDVPRPNSTGRVVKHGVLQLLWMNQLALPNVLQLLSCKCQLNGLYVPAMFVRHKKWAATTACGCIGCQCQNENRERRWPMFCMFWCWPGRSEGHCWHRWWWRCRLTQILWQAMVSLINKRVGKTDWVALTSGRYVTTGTCTLWQLPVFVYVKLIVYFFFRLQVHYWLGSGSGHYKLGTGPIPLSSMYIGHTWHSTCTNTMMYKGQKQLSCNLFCN